MQTNDNNNHQTTDNKQELQQIFDEIEQEEQNVHERQLEMMINEIQRGERIMTYVRFFGVLTLVAIFIIIAFSIKN